MQVLQIKEDDSFHTSSEWEGEIFLDLLIRRVSHKTIVESV
jgi:hypothetical protein